MCRREDHEAGARRGKAVCQSFGVQVRHRLRVGLAYPPGRSRLPRPVQHDAEACLPQPAGIGSCGLGPRLLSFRRTDFAQLQGLDIDFSYGVSVGSESEFDQIGPLSKQNDACF